MQLQILQAQIAQLENEIVQCEARRKSEEMKVTDAATMTGNAGADVSLRNEAITAMNTIEMIDRMLETRRSEHERLTAERETLISEAASRGPKITVDMRGATVQPPTIDEPPRREMKDAPASK